MAIVNPLQDFDAVILFQGTTAACTAAVQGPAIDTNGSSAIVWEVTGNSVFQMTIEGSNDQNLWSTLWTLPISDVAQVDNFSENGHYVLECATRYIRYNISVSSNTLNHTVYGRDSAPSSGADRLSAALDQGSNIAMSVSVVNLKKDGQGALYLSDAAGPYTTLLHDATSSVVYDTTGYNSIVIQQIGGGASVVQISNDGLNWIIPVGVNLNTGSQVSALAAGIFAFSVSARYFRITGTATAGQIVSYFRSSNNPETVATPSGGLAVAVQGTAAVSMATQQPQGSIATNASIAGINPLIIGVSDNNNIGRRVLAINPSKNTAFGGIANTSNVAALAVGGYDQSNTAQIYSFVSPSFQNIPATPVMEVSEHEGWTQTQLLALLLTELQILNHQLHQLPLLLNNGIATNPDEPAALRQEPSLFNN